MVRLIGESLDDQNGRRSQVAECLEKILFVLDLIAIVGIGIDTGRRVVRSITAGCGPASQRGREAPRK